MLGLRAALPSGRGSICSGISGGGSSTCSGGADFQLGLRRRFLGQRLDLLGHLRRWLHLLRRGHFHLGRRCLLR